jgi:hypothetical protein
LKVADAAPYAGAVFLSAQDDQLVIRNVRREDAGRLADIAEQAWQPIWNEKVGMIGVCPIVKYIKAL